MLNGKKIIFATGGTGGHVNPALAVAALVKERCPKAEIVFVGTAEKIESRLVPAAGFELKTIEMSGFSRKVNLKGIKRNVDTALKVIKANSVLKNLFDEFKPDAVIGFGGYVSGPVLRMAQKVGIPTAIHEQNAYPGVANKAVAKKAACVMLTVEKAGKRFNTKAPMVNTGLPIRPDLMKTTKEESRKILNLDSRPLVLSMGGSLGAKAVNEAVLELIIEKHNKAEAYFIHATGRNTEEFIEGLKKGGVDLENEDNVVVKEYIDDMATYLNAADIVISRAGASSLSEIQALGKASILIPSPNVAENHQFHNANA